MADKSGKWKEYAEQLRQLADEIAVEQIDELSPLGATKVRQTIAVATNKLKAVIENLDRYKVPGFVFDPSNPMIAGRVAAIAMIVHPTKPLKDVESFYGSGIYALYYTGDFPSYQPIRGREHPIYVGKADPATLQSSTVLQQGPRLTVRLKDHRRTISSATETLSVDDFSYRALVIKTGYQEAAESYLIDLFKPIWNKEIGICYGFGKHGDDPKTRGNKRSPWDTLHAGRDWARRDKDQEDAAPLSTITAKIGAHFTAHPPLATLEDVLQRFINDMRVLT